MQQNISQKVKSRDFPSHLQPLIEKLCQSIELQTFIDLRRWIHQNAEGENQEFNTCKKLKDLILNLGIQEQEIHILDKTGIVFDIQGELKSHSLNKIDNISSDSFSNDQILQKTIQHSQKIFLFRADIDALKIKEDNPHLEYKSQTEYHHGCGHDGHTACLATAAAFFIKNKQKIPSNITIRILFQPDEEHVGGARFMVEEGCLQRDLKAIQNFYMEYYQYQQQVKQSELIDACFGMHNWPKVSLSEVRSIEGALAAGFEEIEIRVIGKSGHSSSPEKCKDPIRGAAELYCKLDQFAQETLISSNKKILLKICQFHAGTCHNQVPEQVYMNGSIRFLDQNKEFVKKFIDDTSNQIAKALDLSIEVKYLNLSPITFNSQKEYEVVKEVTKSLGLEFSQTQLPDLGSEDFSFYSQIVPSCYYNLGNGIDNDFDFHEERYNFNDDLIPIAAIFWIRLAEKLSGVSFLE